MLDAGGNARHVIGLETNQIARVLTFGLKVLHQWFSIAFFAGIGKKHMNIVRDEVVGKQCHPFSSDAERLSDIALQGVDARAAAMEEALHFAEEGLQLQKIIGFAWRIAVINGGDQHP